MLDMKIAQLEFILGGQKSGKSRRAEALAQAWLLQRPGRSAALLATGQAWDDEMRARIVRHQTDRAQRAPGLVTLEEPLHLAQAIATHSSAEQLLVVDCMTLWLTNWMMPAHGDPGDPPVAALLAALQAAPGPVVLVGNEIGLGVIPMGPQVRAFVDALGHLNQAIAATCNRVTLMVAGLPMTLKDET
jgi:adenosylcobinamide kinase/adenosylcobinamide-phosphate guanylyltransferase